MNFIKQDNTQVSVAKNIYISQQKLSNDFFLHARSHILAYADRHSHMVSLRAKRKGGWEDKKEEAEVLCVFGWLYVQKHVW